MRCDHCSNDVPDGAFCTRCGAHQGTSEEAVGDPKLREHRYAAHPSEHVAQPTIFTTLFPHLGHHKVHEFRWAFIAGLAGVVILYLIGLITAAILVSALLIPVLYLIYLYEAQVYRDEPAVVLGFTIGGGVILGLIVSAIQAFLYHPVLSIAHPFGGGGIDFGALLFAGLLLPIVQEVLKPIPSFLLPNRADFPETVDGLVFGVAAGLGFALAETLVNFGPVIQSLPPQVKPGNWIFPLITIAVLQPLLQGSCTGMIVAAIWRQARGGLGGREIGAVAMAFLAHVAFSLGSIVIADAAISPLAVIIWQTVVVAAVLIYVRYLLHHSLLEEAAHMGYAETVCPSCHRHIVASGFCPNCGRALIAAPAHIKRSRRPRKDVAPPATPTATPAATPSTGGPTPAQPASGEGA